MARKSISSGALFSFHDLKSNSHNLHNLHNNNTLHQNTRRYQTISIPATAYGHPTSSPGAVAGIVLAVVAGTLLVIYLVYFTFIFPRKRRTAVARDDHGDMVEVEEELDYGYGRRRGRGGREADFVDVIEEESSVGGRRPPPRRERPRRAPAGGRKGGGGGWWWGGGGGGGGGGSSVSRSSLDSRDRGNTVEVMEEVDPPAPEPPRMKRTRKPRRQGGGGRRRGDDPFGID